jgi:hypothetical protein
MRVRRSYHHCVDLACQIEIVTVTSPAGQQTGVFQTPQRLADTGTLRMRRKPRGGGHVVAIVPSSALDSERKGLM